MFDYIKGIYAGMNKDYIVIENNNIGYKIYTSGSTLSLLPNPGESVMLYLQQIVREDFVGLYGFTTREELDLFNLLLTINGVGAKASLSLLSISNVENLKKAIVFGDENLLIRAPGIGKKTSQRIILELKDKIKINESNIAGDVNLKGSGNNIEEVIGALLALGYTQKEAEKAVKNSDIKDSVEETIKNCLKFLMN